ncbi:hypothetical protein FQZ97_1145710 [compost metagenome]
MHGEHHDRANEDEKGIGAVDQRFHGTIQVIHEYRQLQSGPESTKTARHRQNPHHNDAMPTRYDRNSGFVQPPGCLPDIPSIWFFSSFFR